MPLMFKVKSLEGIAESLHDSYKKEGEEYVLQVDGLEDVGPLKRAHERVKQERDTLKTELTESKSQFEEMEGKLQTALSSQGSPEQVEQLRESYEAKIARMGEEHATTVGQLQGGIQEMLVDNKALELASSIAVDGSADLLLPHIKARLATEQVDGKYKTVVKDAEGKASALTLEDLSKEFASNPAFAPVVAGTKGSGGDASSSQNNGGDASIDLATASPKEAAAYLKSKRGS